MTTRRSAVRLERVADGDAGRRLDNFLLSRLKDAPKSLVYKLVRSGQVRVNGGRVDDWAAPGTSHPMPAIGANADFDQSCRKLATRRLDPSPATPRAAMKPWGAIVAGNRSANIAMRAFAQVRQRHPKLFTNREPLVVKKASPGMGASRIAYVMIGADSRTEAEAFCARLHAAGGDCLVERN